LEAIAEFVGDLSDCFFYNCTNAAGDLGFILKKMKFDARSHVIAIEIDEAAAGPCVVNHRANPLARRGTSCIFMLLSRTHGFNGVT
jgi:hypothetical protein